MQSNFHDPLHIIFESKEKKKDISLGTVEQLSRNCDLVQ